MPDDELLDVGRAGPPEGPGGAGAADAPHVGRSDVRRRSSTTSSGSGCSFAESRGRRRIRTCSRSSTRTSGRRSSRKPISSSRARCAKTVSVIELLSADYTFLNERLAQHYEIPNVSGSRFRRVSFAGPAARRAARDGRRAGGDLLRKPHVAGAARQVDAREPARHAAAAAAGRCAAVPPGGGRERRDPVGARAARGSTARIRSAPTVTRPMDPLGFALENFDAVGQVADARRQRARSTPPGSWSTARSSPARPNCARRSSQRRSQIVRTISEKMLTYALGRGLESTTPRSCARSPGTPKRRTTGGRR